METKNLMRSSFRSYMQEAGIRLVLFVPPQKKELYQQFFGDTTTIVEAITDIESKPTKLKILFRSIARAAIPTETIWIRQIYSWKETHNPFAFVWKRGIWHLGHFKWFRQIIHWMEYALFRDDHLWDHFFDTYKPDAVFATNVIHDVSIALMKAAKRRHIPCVGMVKSWDNLSSKGLLRFHPPVLLVNNDIMRKEAVEWNDMPVEGIRVVGVPQYDTYLDSSWIIPREEFLRSLQLDPALPTITYFGGGLLTGILDEDDPTDHILMLVAAMERRELPACNIILRAHPKFAFKKEPSPKLLTLKNFHISKPGRDIKGLVNDWEFSEDDIRLLINTIRCSAVTINTGSSMSLECALLDKPIIITGFNGYSEVPWEKNIGISLDHTTHYQYVESTGGTTRVRSEAEYIKTVRHFLTNPEMGREGRSALIHTILGGHVGHAGKNVTDEVLRIITK